MLTTEKEAAQKRCIKIAAAMVALDPQTRNAALLTDGDKCIGSRCMAWRWAAEYDATSRMLMYGFCGEAGNPNVER